MEAILGMLIPVLFVVMMMAERIWPGRTLPKVRGWVAKGVAFFFLTAVVNALLPSLVTSLLAGVAPFNISGWGIALSAIVCFVVTDFFQYWIHRFMHRVPAVWRLTHQLHHSAERVDMAGSAYFHPTDMVISVGLLTVVAVLLGLSPEAAAIAGFAGFVWGVFPHLNVRTPKWLGYIIGRPEAHSIHHERGVHAYNYANIPVWDIAFGTFRNPNDFAVTTGFWDGASSEVLPMLLGRDVGVQGGRATDAGTRPRPA